MTLEEPEPNPITDHILDSWLEDSVSFFSSFLDDQYNSDDFSSYQWWDPNQEINQDLINACANSATTTTTTSSSLTATTPLNPLSPTYPLPLDSSKKRKASNDLIIPQPSQGLNPSKNHSQDADEKAVPRRINKKGMAKSAANCNSGSNQEGRWAEQLLNPCATAVTAGNMSRVQHLMYVLHELASPTGDPNHRLAFHGLRSLAHHLSSSTSVSNSAVPTFASSEPRFFRKSLLKFNEISPWFAFPSNVANSSILQILSEEPNKSRNLHILDIGVSHGAQWPTLLDGLTRRPGGPPPLVRLTIVSATMDNDGGAPFSMGPPSYDFSSQLLEFAKSININLEINRLDDHSLQTLNSHSIQSSMDENLIVSCQFRLHHLNHSMPDERTNFLKTLRGLEPKGVVLSENNSDCSCTNCVDFATGFSRRVEYLWRFLDSTSSAFKGRDSDERKMMEGEAAKALTNRVEMNEGKDKWCERMREAGFVGELFGEDAIDGARALLRKHDGNWEMRVEEKLDGCVSLWWKGQPVSFCSLWKLDGRS